MELLKSYFEILIPFLWVLHALFLLLISSILKNEEIDIKCFGFLFLFYSLPFLFSFKFLFFEVDVFYSPSVVPLFSCIFFDVILIIFLKILKLNKQKIAAASKYNSIIVSYGSSFLVGISCIAFIAHIIFNYHLFLLPKHEFIASVKTPNLLFFSIPCELIICGYVIKKNYRVPPLLLIFFLAIVVLSVLQGYRHLIFFVSLYLLFTKWPKISLWVPVLVFTFLGELSNIAKGTLQVLIASPENVSAWLEYSFSNEYLTFLSSEQMAIVSNFVIGSPQAEFGGALLDLFYLFPFSERIFGLDGASISATRLGNIVLVGEGQGTGYNYLLGIIESLGLNLFLLFILILLIKITSRSFLSFLLVSISFSFFRDNMAFLSSQIKMFIILFILISVCAFIYYLMPKKLFSYREKLRNIKTNLA
jgi:hypothetical protein